jgi:uncharacterized protein (TIGR00255 family)
VNRLEKLVFYLGLHMMKSMTGYGIAEKMSETLIIKAEFKSLNGKNLDLSMRMPKFLQDKELVIRNRFVSQLERGSIVVSIYIEKRAGYEEALSINYPLFEKYYKELEALAEHLGADKKDLFRSTLTMPDITKTEDKSLIEGDWELILAACDAAYQQYDEYRITEGKQTETVLLTHCEAIEIAMPGIEALEQERMDRLKARLVKNLEELQSGADYDKNRFEQELIYYLEKWDIHEEKSRLKAHCELFKDSLNHDVGGKRLGFISQEMGREINTLGSKANHAGIQTLVIGMKENLEKIKEQLYNII